MERYKIAYHSLLATLSDRQLVV